MNLGFRWNCLQVLNSLCSCLKNFIFCINFLLDLDILSAIIFSLVLMYSDKQFMLLFIHKEQKIRENAFPCLDVIAALRVQDIAVRLSDQFNSVWYLYVLHKLSSFAICVTIA